MPHTQAEIGTKNAISQFGRPTRGSLEKVWLQLKFLIYFDFFDFKQRLEWLLSKLLLPTLLIEETYLYRGDLAET